MLQEQLEKVINMRYMGSKDRHAKHLVPILMNNHDWSKPYVEPFVGGGNLIYQIPCGFRWGNDSNEWAVALLKALSEGWEPPEHLSESDYYLIKEDPYGYPPETVGFAAFCCSYAGKEWGGYARGVNSRGEPRNFAAEQKRNLLKQSKGLSGIEWTNEDYTTLTIQEGSTVYCDPPYEGTTKYKSQFSHEVFWCWCEGLIDSGCRVFVSEYNAPEGWVTVWEKTVTSSLTRNTGSKEGVEKLFTKGKS